MLTQQVVEAAQRLFAWQKLKEANFPTGCKHPYQGDSGLQETADTKLVCTELLVSGNPTMDSKAKTDCIGGFDYVDPRCLHCGKPLELKNAWMTDGCPCNGPLGVNNINETRWRLLMQLQQQQSIEIEKLKKSLFIATHSMH